MPDARRESRSITVAVLLIVRTQLFYETLIGCGLNPAFRSAKVKGGPGFRDVLVGLRSIPRHPPSTLPRSLPPLPLQTPAMYGDPLHLQPLYCRLHLRHWLSTPSFQGLQGSTSGVVHQRLLRVLCARDRWAVSLGLGVHHRVFGRYHPCGILLGPVHRWQGLGNQLLVQRHVISTLNLCSLKLWNCQGRYKLLSRQTPAQSVLLVHWSHRLADILLGSGLFFRRFNSWRGLLRRLHLLLLLYGTTLRSKHHLPNQILILGRGIRALALSGVVGLADAEIDLMVGGGDAVRVIRHASPALGADCHCACCSLALGLNDSLSLYCWWCDRRTYGVVALLALYEHLGGGFACSATAQSIEGFGRGYVVAHVRKPAAARCLSQKFELWISWRVRSSVVFGLQIQINPTLLLGLCLPRTLLTLPRASHNLLRSRSQLGRAFVRFHFIWHLRFYLLKN